MTGITLTPITVDNHKALRALRVLPEQEGFVATVEASLSDAYVYEDAEFRGVFEGDEPVGYVMIFPFDRDEHRLVNIVRLMIAGPHQGRGLGRATLELTLDWIRSLEPAVDLIRISVVPENEVALGLYLSLGFETKGLEDGEVALYLRP